MTCALQAFHQTVLQFSPPFLRGLIPKDARQLPDICGMKPITVPHIFRHVCPGIKKKFDNSNTDHYMFPEDPDIQLCPICTKNTRYKLHGPRNIPVRVGLYYSLTGWLEAQVKNPVTRSVHS